MKHHPSCPPNYSEKCKSSQCKAYDRGFEAGRAEYQTWVIAYLRGRHEPPKMFMRHQRDHDIADHLEECAKADNTNRETGSRDEERPDPTASAFSNGVDTNSQGASLGAANVAMPRLDPRSAPASSTRLSSVAKADVVKS